MTMPLNLVLVRHGESEGNIANKRSRTGDHADFTEEFRARHSSTWKLTETGCAQADAAGKWIRKNLAGVVFDRCYTSPYARAMETALLLDIPYARWFLEPALREKEHGEMDVLSDDIRQEKWKHILKRMKCEPYYTKFPNGESQADLCERIHARILGTLHRECRDANVIVVCHAEVMWAFRVLLERISPSEYLRLDRSGDSNDHIHNGQVIHYTRRSPKEGSKSQHLSWLRSVCPWDESRSASAGEWQNITRTSFSNDMLLKELGAKYPEQYQKKVASA